MNITSVLLLFIYIAISFRGWLLVFVTLSKSFSRYFGTVIKSQTKRYHVMCWPMGTITYVCAFVWGFYRFLCVCFGYILHKLPWNRLSWHNAGSHHRAYVVVALRVPSSMCIYWEALMFHHNHSRTYTQY